MKKPSLLLLIVVALLNNARLYAQAVVCPSLAANSPVLSCSEPCATLTATPSVNLNATTSYSVAAVAYAPFPYTGTAWTMPGGAGWSTGTDDNFGKVITLPFSFCFFGSTYTSLAIGTNGNVSFNAVGGAYDPYSISGPLPGSNCAATENCIMGVWNDTYVGGGPITYASYGTAPCRQFVVSWDSVDLYLPGTYCTGNRTKSQIVIYESSNIIDVYIGKRTHCPAWNPPGLAVCGIENASGSTFVCPPGENGTTFDAVDLGWRFTPTGASSAWTYNWAGPGGASVGTTATVVLCPTVTTVYTVSAISIACTGVSVSTTATVTTTGSTTPITGTPSMCLGFTTNLTDVTTGGVWASGNPGVATVSGSGLVTSASGGTATISYTVSGCTSTYIVTVNTAPAITGTTTLCAGGTTTLNDAVGGGTWISGNTSVANIGFTTGVVTAGAGAGTSMITYTTPAGCVTTTPVTVVLLTPITGVKIVCQGSTTALFNSTGGGTWASAPASVATIGAASGVVNGVGGGVANITYTTPGGCFTTTTVTVNPVSPIGGPLAMCQNFSATLTDALTGGAWSSGSPSVAIVNAATGDVTGLSGGNATISYILPTGCLMTVVVVIHPKPAPPVTDPQTYCQFAVPGPVSATGTSLLWYGPGVTAGMAVAPVPVTSVGGIIDYYVTQATSFGCVSDSATDVVTITPQPAPPVTHDTAYCQFYTGQVVPLNFEVDSAAGSVLNWFNSSGTPLPGAPLPTTGVATYPAGTTWNVSQTVNGCTSNTAPVTVTIVPTPKFTLNYQNWVCQYDSLVLSYTLSPGSVLVGQQYFWALPFGTLAVDGTNVTGPSVYVAFDSANVNYYTGTLTIGNLAGECSSIDTFTVKVIPAPYAHAYSNPNICLGDTVSLALVSKAPGATNFYWFIDGAPMFSSGTVNVIAASSNTGGPFNISWNQTGMHFITVECSTEQGCMSLPTNDTVDVHALPDATFDVDPKTKGTLCFEDSILFVAHNSDVNCNYLWQPEPCFNNNNKPNIWGKAEQNRTDIMLTVTDPYGCKATSDQQLNPSSCCEVLFPNAFTPNGDGRNDFFRPIFNGYHNFHSFMIVNRWGQTVFESANSTPEWDGNFNGVPQDMGTYFYYIKYDCGGATIEQKGDCTLIR